MHFMYKFEGIPYSKTLMLCWDFFFQSDFGIMKGFSDREAYNKNTEEIGFRTSKKSDDNKLGHEVTKESNDIKTGFYCI